MKRCINLGSGYKNKQSTESEIWINIDSNPKTAPDILRDLNLGLPFDNDSIDEVYSSHFLEHVNDMKILMEECYRVLKDKGIFSYIVPYALKGQGGFAHLEHKHFFTESWYKFFCEWSEFNDYNCEFELINQELKEDPEGNYYLEGSLKKKEWIRNPSSPAREKIKETIDKIDFEKEQFYVIIAANNKAAIFSNMNREGRDQVFEFIKEK